MKALMSLREEQEEYIQRAQREKQELKQEMESKSRSLEEAQRQLEEVRANRHRVDQDVVVSFATVFWNKTRAERLAQTSIIVCIVFFF